jgi:hypothetical protein
MVVAKHTLAIPIVNLQFSNNPSIEPRKVICRKHTLEKIQLVEKVTSEHMKYSILMLCCETYKETYHVLTYNSYTKPLPISLISIAISAVSG